VWKREHLRKQEAENALHKLTNEYAYSLRLESISFEEYREQDRNTKQLKNRSGQFVLNFRNTISRPISYKIERIVLDGDEQANLGTRGGVVSALSPATFYCERRPVTVPDDTSSISRIELQLTYGHPDGHSRRMAKTLTVELYPSSQKTKFLYQQDDDLPI
jgi:hypothetical protein